MKKIITLTLISLSLFGCSHQSDMLLSPLPEQNSAVINSNTSHWGDLIDDKTFALKKDKTIQRVMNNIITVKPDNINHDKNALLIYFSNGELSPGSHFHLVMDIKINNDQFGKRGDSWIMVKSSYFGGLTLTKAEAAKILFSAENYKKYSAQLDKIFR